MFLLVRLLSLDQPVLLRSIDTALLFYHGTVYSRPAEDAFKNLPGVQDDLPEDEEYFPVWALIDEGSKDGPAISRSMNIWPIQASSPLPDRYKSWRKKTGASLLGMPLWNMTELNKGYVLSSLVLSKSIGAHRRLSYTFAVYFLCPSTKHFDADWSIVFVRQNLPLTRASTLRWGFSGQRRQGRRCWRSTGHAMASTRRGAGKKTSSAKKTV